MNSGDTDIITQSELIVTNNSLYDIISWLRMKHMVCIHANNNFKFFYYKETVLNKAEFNKNKLIYIDISTYTNLLNDDEWSWYIKEEGFVNYKSIEILPDNIYKFEL